MNLLRNLMVSGVLLGATSMGFMVVAEQISGPAYNIAQVSPAPGGSTPKKPPESKKGPEAKGAPKAKQEGAAAHAAPKGLAAPKPEVLLIMIRSALTALDQANKTNNYSVLQALGGPMMQQHSPEGLAQMFQGVRKSGVDLQPVLVMTPQITEAPVIAPNGLLALTGYFPTQPLQIRFQVGYQPVAGVWRLAGINLSLVSVAAAGPASSPASASQQPASKSQK